MCKRLDLVTYKACGEKMWDTFHRVCLKHSPERAAEHTAYHLCNKFIDITNLTNTIKRRQIAAESILEMLLRDRYRFKYQLNRIHFDRENILASRIREFWPSMAVWYDWTITEKTALQINNSEMLNQVNVEDVKNLERELVRRAEIQKLEIIESDREREEFERRAAELDLYLEEERHKRKERKRLRKIELEAGKFPEEENIDVDSDSDSDTEKYTYEKEYRVPTSFDMFFDICSIRGFCYYDDNRKNVQWLNLLTKE